MAVNRSFANIYTDPEYEGRFIISNYDWKSWEEAFENRDQLGNYIETVEIIRRTDDE